MKYNIGFTVDSELKRLLDVIPNGQRSEVIRQAIRAYASKIESMKVELDRIRKENLQRLEIAREKERLREIQIRRYYERLANHEVRCWLNNLNLSNLDVI